MAAGVVPSRIVWVFVFDLAHGIDTDLIGFAGIAAIPTMSSGDACIDASGVTNDELTGSDDVVFIGELIVCVAGIEDKRRKERN